MRIVLSLLVALSCAFSLSTQAAELSSWDRFKLWNDCEPMQLVVEKLSADASDIGLEREALEISVRSRLRAARIYGLESKFYLHLIVSIVGRAFSIEITYNKVLHDIASAETGYAITWVRSGTGTHGQDSSYVISLVSQYTDEFIDEYLRVNDAACGR
ncbi:MAG: hypothetical protein F4Y03_16720 [Alphaproteobacteria bacterium]|nr:hypothetical protein [Alphaproteobacteria bacterium]